MATKKRTTIPAPAPEDDTSPESETDVETTGSMNVDTDVEHTDSSAQPAIGSVESQDAPTGRVNIESGEERNAGDVERGPA
ncbi:hypothetical protein [Herbaspirillum sp. SJZ107]|jgi:hypothetical protein|uniref:hypothetical protein n=1 Tax=Oxalobacteraceae TaxID=75682 RepID=UPI0011549653|nr:hypothetical protein [Herbaspirillum sp. SJZ107]TQK01195.1 hypothetical protein FBX97_5719 [Herbaspirillum sp. SJZ107]